MSTVGQAVFEHIVNSSQLHDNQTEFSITHEQYLEWQKHALFDGIFGIKYGRSFCTRHDIKDNFLCYYLTAEQADDYIRAIYVR